MQISQFQLKLQTELDKNPVNEFESSKNHITTTLRAHDCNDGVRESTVGELHRLNKFLKTGNVEFAIGVDQLRRTRIF